MVFDLLARDRASSEVGKVGESMERAGDSADGLGDRVSGMFGKLAGVAAGAGLAVGASFVSMLESQGANTKLTAQLGLDPAESAAAGKLAGSLYAGNYGDSLESVNEAVGVVASSIDGLGDVGSEAMGTATRDALNFASAFDTDVAGAAQSVGILIRNGLVADATEGFDLMTAAYQQVPAAMRDELPAILDEYGTNFRALGYSGEQSMALLVDAAQRGPIVLDKMGDALKEFTIRGTDMSKASVSAYEAIGLSADDMAAKLVAGGPAAQEATQQVAAGLLGIEDPVARANNAIALFGTPLEDLSVDQIPQFLQSVSMANGELEGVSGTAAALDATLSSGLGPRLETLKRGAQQAATQGVGALLAGFTQGKTDAEGWQGKVQNLAASVSDKLQPALDTASSFVTGTVLPALGSLFGYLSEHEGTVTAIAYAITGVLGAAFLVWGARAIMAAGQNALAWLSVVTSSNTGAAATQRSALQVVARWAYMSVAAVLHGAKVAAVWTVQMVLAAARGAASLALSAARVVAGWALMSLQAALNGAKIAGVWTAQMIASAARGAASLAVSAARVVAGWVLMGVQSMLQAGRMAAAWLIAMGPVGWVIAAVVGLVALIVLNWDKIKTFTVNAWNGAVSAVTGAWSRLTGAVSSGISTAVSFVSGLPGKVAGALGGFGSTLYSAGTDLIQGLINGAGSMLRNIGRFFLDMVPGWIRGPFESALGIASPSKVFAQYGRFIGEGLIVGIGGTEPGVTKAGRDLAGFVRSGFASTIDGTVAEASAGIKDLNAKVLAAAKEGNAARLKATKDSNADELAAARAQISKTNAGVKRMLQQQVEAIKDPKARAAMKARNADLYAGVKQAGVNAIARITAEMKAEVRGVEEQNAAALAAASSFASAMKRADNQLMTLAKRREAVATQLEAARDRLADAVKLRNDYRGAITDAARSYADVTSIKTGGSSAVLVDDLRTRLAAITAFRTKLAKLAKLGLSDDMYKQIADAGVEGGTATADALLSGGAKAVGSVNYLSKQIAKQSTGLGTDAAKELYQAGVDSAAGLVNGLAAKSSALKAAAERLATQLTDAVKAKLGIRSPSRVFAGIGNNIGQGLADGIGAMRPVVASELAALADTAAFDQMQASAGIDTGVTGSGGLGYRAPRYDATAADAAPAAVSSVRTVNVSGVVGPQEVAAIVRREQATDEFLAGAGA